MQDKVVVITGASGGLGKTVARRLAKEGARLALVARNKQKLNDLCNELGDHSRAYACDITDAEQIHAAVGQILKDFGRIDILINNAGVWTDEELEQSKPILRKQVLDVNTFGTIEFTKAVEPTLRTQKSGHILNVISTSGTADVSSGDNRGWQTYGASKWAIAGFTRALKDSLESSGIKVTGFYPGGFESNIFETAGMPEAHEQPWMMRTEDVAEALIFCLTRPADVVVEKMVVTKHTVL